jgi:hypothetical protein
MPKAATSPRYRDPLTDRDVGLFESFIDSQALLMIMKNITTKWEARRTYGA